RPAQSAARRWRQESERACCFEDAQHGHPRFRHARVSHRDTDLLIANKIVRGREDVSGGGQDGDREVGVKHGNSDSYFAMPTILWKCLFCSIASSMNAATALRARVKPILGAAPSRLR